MEDQQEIASEGTTFHEKVLVAITRLGTVGAVQHTEVITRLNKINGHIDDLYERSEKSKLELMAHASQCILKDKVNQIEVRLASGEFTSSHDAVQRIVALETAVAKMLEASRWIKPGIVAAMSCLIVLVLLHVHEILMWAKIVK